MDASILVAGGDAFLAAVLKPIHELAASTVEVACNPAEAAPLIQAQQPDILILQAKQTGNLELCHQIKSQSRLAWIYCLVVECQTQKEIQPLHGDDYPDTYSKIEALEAGADAYLYLNFDAANAPDLANCNDHQCEQYRLLQAYVQAGLRQVQTHRDLVRTNDLLSAIALSDPLTELNNRRAFEWELPRQIHNARTRNMPISLVMLDVDFFKSINDTYGHLVGDRALQLISARLRHNLRFYDTPFRYGGEEFVIVLSDTSCQEANLIAQRICGLIADHPFAIDSTLDLNITISAGAASLLPDDDLRGVSLLQRADRNLLKAKSQGRNCAISCRDHPSCSE